MPRPLGVHILTRRGHDVALALATIAVLCCTAVLAWQRTGTRWDGTDGTAEYRVAVFLQERDCTSNLALLRLLARPELSERLSVVVYGVGGSESVNRLTTRLRAQELSFKTLAAPRGALAAVKRMGYQATPVFVLLDRDNRVRLMTAAPETPEELHTLASALRLLTGYIDEPKGAQ